MTSRSSQTTLSGERYPYTTPLGIIPGRKLIELLQGNEDWQRDMERRKEGGKC